MGLVFFFSSFSLLNFFLSLSISLYLLIHSLLLFLFFFFVSSWFLAFYSNLLQSVHIDQQSINPCWIDFIGTSTVLGLFYAWRLGNCIHYTFISTFFVLLFLKMYLLTVIYQVFVPHTTIAQSAGTV